MVDKTCLIDRDFVLGAKQHGMTAEEFYNMPEDFKRKYYCADCRNGDCYAKREANRRPERIRVESI